MSSSFSSGIRGVWSAEKYNFKVAQRAMKDHLNFISKDLNQIFYLGSFFAIPWVFLTEEHELVSLPLLYTLRNIILVRRRKPLKVAQHAITSILSVMIWIKYFVWVVSLLGVLFRYPFSLSVVKWTYLLSIYNATIQFI